MSNFLYAVEREYDIPVEVLWDAWTDSAALESWYHPTDLACVPGSVESEPVVGGLWTVAVDVPQMGFAAYFFGTYTEVSENVLLAHTMHYTQDPVEFAERDFMSPHHDVRVEFESRGMRSWVRFSQFGEMPEAQIIQTQQGMESYFDSLENSLAAGAPQVP